MTAQEIAVRSAHVDASLYELRGGDRGMHKEMRESERAQRADRTLTWLRWLFYTLVALGEGGLVKADWSSVAETVMRTISGYAETWGAILPPIIIIIATARGLGGVASELAAGAVAGDELGEVGQEHGARVGFEGPSGQRPASDTVISRLLGGDMFEGTVLETRFAPVAALLVTVFLACSCATSTSVSTPTAAEELAGIEARLEEVLTRQTFLEKLVEARREARPVTAPDFSNPNNPLRKAVAALEPVLDHIESDLLAFQTKYPEHPESRGVKPRVDSIRKLIRALLAGETLPSMTVAEPPVICPGTSRWNGRGCTTEPVRPAHRTKLSPAFCFPTFPMSCPPFKERAE